MTVPAERRRAIDNTREFLRALLDPRQTPRIPREIRRKAYWCLKHYPTEYDMSRTGPESIWGAACLHCGSVYVREIDGGLTCGSCNRVSQKEVTVEEMARLYNSLRKPAEKLIRAERDRLEPAIEALRLIALGPRPDGSFNRSRDACREIAKAALLSIGEK
jgi:hypothetical protein